MDETLRAGRRAARAWTLALGAASALACGGDNPAVDVRVPAREAGQLALPPSANAPRVMRESTTPDTFQPAARDEFALLGGDSLSPGDFMGDFPGTPRADLTIDRIAAAYRGHYATALGSEGSAVRNRIDRELQKQAENRTARDQGYAGWVEMIGALTPEQRARLVDRLNEANIDLARELHGSGATAEPGESRPEG